MLDLAVISRKFPVVPLHIREFRWRRVRTRLRPPPLAVSAQKRVSRKRSLFWTSLRRSAEVARLRLAFCNGHMRRHGRPKTIVPDRPGWYRAAMSAIGNASSQACRRWLDNRAENSHQPLRRRARGMAKLKDTKTIAEICRDPRLDLQSFQSTTSSYRSRRLQE